ncbi:MAG: hypothetical protein RSA01_04685 [Clostridium sp.]|uniref:hypothetical protein n=1 Tax=Clostridium sp. TaxID=1506 RepID=UPI002FCA9268
MSPKELLYIADALGHEEFMKCKTSEGNLQDASLQNLVTQINAKHQEIFSKFMQLL